jgi:hypothetical protein
MENTHKNYGLGRLSPRRGGTSHTSEPLQSRPPNAATSRPEALTPGEPLRLNPHQARLSLG